jgi:hypothetical protein
MKPFSSSQAAKTVKVPVPSSYDELGVGLIIALVLFPIPVVFIVLARNYSPKTKLCWSLVAAAETLAWAATVIIPLYSFLSAFSSL